MYYKDGWLDKLNRKFGRYGIPNLMTVIVGGMGIVFLMDFILSPVTNLSLQSFLVFNREAVLHGQLWRLVTFVFIPPDSSIVFILFSLYFYWILGNALENQWGTFRFNVYYLCGMLGTVVAGMITGYAGNSYLNLSLFFAFALLNPDFELLVFFFLPVKIKYLALLDAAGLTLMLIRDSWAGRLALLVALGNVILFFWPDFMDRCRNAKRRYEFRKKAGKYWK